MGAQVSRYNFRNGVPPRGATSPFFVLKHQKSDSQEIKIAVVVSKKVDKRATARNLIKRRVLHALREILRDRLEGVDMVIYTRKPIASSTYQDIAQALQQILKKEGII